MAIATSWSFINKSKYQLAEDLKVFNEDKLKDLTFYYPVSWGFGKFIASEGNPKRYAIFNKNEKDESKGAINIFINENEGGKNKILEKVLKRFDDGKINIDLNELKEISNSNNYIEKQWKAEGYIDEKGSLNNGEIIIQILKTKKRFVLLELVGVNKEYDYYQSARNRRAFDIIIHTLKTSEKVSSVVASKENNPTTKKKKGFFDFLG